MTIERASACVLMFSGGRDSTLAALRLARTCEHLVLATVTSDHLFGYENVRARLRELRRYLPPETLCVRIAQPPPRGAEVLQEATCLPCHREYVTVGVLLARNLGIKDLAFGYVGYQNHWPEQTQDAIARLSEILRDIGIVLHVPVQDVGSRGEAIDELVRLEMSPEALEQKCLQQQRNKELPPDALKLEIDRWELSTQAQLRALGSTTLEIISEAKLAEVN